MNNDKITRTNPVSMPKPVGKYTHITKIPRNAEWFVTSGQIGIDPNGQFPENMNEQIGLTFANIHNVLAAEGLCSDHIIKVNIWAIEPIDWNYLYSEWERFFNDEYPAMTVAYVTALGLPEIKIEIEIWAAKV
ncbi:MULTISPECIES: RidA family protein [Paenibacillus]|uniref:Enamine deaminase RidA n=1 Tax=Paenibacillus campinasensis TaxID=66347 RepID=A0A268F205_9BACL|nr:MULTISPECIES: RidA family protein [Paenibacillus]MUG65859.1 RidA family protein [Paenibacillus campinasensis]PAD79400.1 enamine deaminase RidA [Paenibacillus campinasensis]PAK51657.1 enamine deaminase RidA [Paenibacillus sp. 7541]